MIKIQQYVSFPNFNINLKISKIAFFGIRWYAIMIVGAILIGVILYSKDRIKYGIKNEQVYNLLIYVLPISIIGARIYYVLFKLDYYIKNPIQIFNIRDGGLAIYGGLIAGLITIIIYCKKRKINILNLLDGIAPYIALGQSIGRWGNFFNVEAYGIETQSLLKMGIIENGIYKEVHPTFLYESVSTFLLSIILKIAKKNRKFEGQVVCLYLIIYSLFRIFIEELRMDSLMLGNIRVSQLLSVFIFIFSTIIYIRKYYNYITKMLIQLTKK